MPVQLCRFITRQMMRENPSALFVFEDTMLRAGWRVGRGEPNGVGIPTKWTLGLASNAYFRNLDFDNPEVRAALETAFVRLEVACLEGRAVVLPEQGVVGADSQLARRAPAIFEFITEQIGYLHRIKPISSSILEDFREREPQHSGLREGYA